MIGNNQKLNGGQKFLIGMILVYFLGWFYNKNFIENAFNEFGKMFFKVAPLIIIVFFVMFFVNIFVTPDMIKKYLGKGSGKKGFLYALLASIFFSGPPYIIFPLLGDLRKHGMSNSFAATFLSNRNVMVPFIPAMIFYFGLKYTLVVSFYILVFAVINGFIMGKIMEKEK